MAAAKSEIVNQTETARARHRKPDFELLNQQIWWSTEWLDHHAEEFDDLERSILVYSERSVDSYIY